MSWAHSLIRIREFEIETLRKRLAAIVEQVRVFYVVLGVVLGETLEVFLCFFVERIHLSGTC